MMMMKATIISHIYGVLPFLLGMVSASSHFSLLRGGRFSFRHQEQQQATRALQASTTDEYAVIQDTFVRSSSPTKNYGVTNTNLRVEVGSGDAISFVKFPIAFAVRTAESIVGAKMFLRLNNAPAVSLKVDVYPMDTEDWVESEPTYNDFPSYDTSKLIATETLVPASDDQFIEFDISSAFIAAAQAQNTTISLALQGDASNPTAEAITFDAKEDLVYIPYVAVTYVPSAETAPPSTTPTAAPTVDWEQPEYPQLVSVGTDGHLDYIPYANEINYMYGSQANPAAVNTVPDFSTAGYKQGGEPIPFVPVVATLEPHPTGDEQRAEIQAAIDAVAAMTPDANGIRGAILLKAGSYKIGNPGIHIYDSGIVIRGEGQGVSGTVLTFTSTVKESNAITLGFTNGKAENIEPNQATYSVTDAYTPVGSLTLNIADAATMSPGDDIIVQLMPNDDWLYQMSDMAQWGWTAAGYQVTWRRVVTAVNGNQITLNAPIVQAIEGIYGGAVVYRYEMLYNGQPVEIQNVGVENIRIESTFAGPEDEDHGKHAVFVQRVRNGWVRQLTAVYFWQGAVILRRNSMHVTVEDSAALDPKGTLAGGRRYPFVVDDGEGHLFQRCYADEFRHTFATGSQTSGPLAFVDSSAFESYNDVGPHERLGTGQLYDNIRTSINPADDGNGGEMNVQNRGPSGSGHGWAGTQIMFWNCNATQWRLHAANGAMSWAIGMEGQEGDRFIREPEPDGIFQSLGSFVTPRSLYYAQLKERKGMNSLHSMILPIQRTGPIWDDLDAWMGEGLFGDPIVAWYDEESPVSTGSPLDIGGMVRDLILLGNSPSYTWSMISGPGNAVFGSSSFLETTVTFDTTGNYELELLVSDGTTAESASIVVPVTSTGPVQTSSPTNAPSGLPTSGPTFAPSFSPTTEEPTNGPTVGPTNAPTGLPTSGPTLEPTHLPTEGPATSGPTSVPTAGPASSTTSGPTLSPSFSPTTEEPTNSPTGAPTTKGPTFSPSFVPTDAPTSVPTTEGPTFTPTFVPTGAPTGVCAAFGDACIVDADCCDNKCRGGNKKTCKK